MKKIVFPASLLFLALFSCSKDDAPPPPTVQGTSYMNLSAGSARNFEFTSIKPPAPVNLYTTTSTTKDTTIGSRTYHVFRSSRGGSEYYHKSGSDYYAYQRLPAALGNSSIENLYLKDNVAVNTSWNQTFNINVTGIPLTVNIINKIIEKGISKTVNLISYTDVIHVKTDITASTIFGPVTGFTTDIHTYYAPIVGQIQNNSVIDLDFMGFVEHTNTQTILKSATIL